MSRAELIAFDRWGSGPLPLLLLHGFTGAGRSFRSLEPHLAQRFCALAPDLPGHGAAAPASTFESCLSALEELLRAQPSPVVLHGYSMGARLALALALRCPGRVQALSLESGTAGLADEAERAARRTADEELARAIEQQGVAAFVDRWEREPLLAGLRELPTGAQAGLRALRLSQSAGGLASALRALGPGTAPPLWARLSALKCPVLLSCGERDAKYAALAARLQRQLPDARLVVLPGVGHTPHLEAPAALARTLLAFAAPLAPPDRAAAPDHSRRST